MALSKLKKMQNFVPSLYRPTVNPVNRGILYAISGEDDNIVSAVRDAKEQLFVVTAQLQYLDALGSNVGVFRPTAFNLSDSIYRRLIPKLSFAPKQVVPTIQAVLDIFFGENNPRVHIAQIRPNTIDIRMPSSVPALRRSLKGSLHFHSYSGTITNIETLTNEITIDLDEPTKQLKEDEVQGGIFGQDADFEIILANAIGNTGVVIQFDSGADLTKFDNGGRFAMTAPNYPGSYIPDPTSAFTVTKQRGILGQSIVAGTQVPTIIMQEASGIPDQAGRVIFNWGHMNEESLIRYFGRPNNSTLLLDPGYNFLYDHSPDEVVNVVVTPYKKPRNTGDDYAVYLVGVTAARILAQEIIRSIVAAGIVVNFTLIGPTIEC